MELAVLMQHNHIWAYSHAVTLQGECLLCHPLILHNQVLHSPIAPIHPPRVGVYATRVCACAYVRACVHACVKEHVHVSGPVFGGWRYDNNVLCCTSRTAVLQFGTWVGRQACDVILWSPTTEGGKGIKAGRLLCVAAVLGGGGAYAFACSVCVCVCVCVCVRVLCVHV